MASELHQAYALLQQGKQQKALKIFQRILKSDPANFLALDGAGSIYGQMGRYNDALSCFNRARKIKPDDFAVHFNCGIALMELGRYDEALASLERTLMLKPDMAEACNSIGNALLALKRYPEALEYFDRAIALKPDYPTAYNSRGMALLEMQASYQEAAACFERAISLRPDLAEAHYNRGLLFTRLKRLENAIECYNKAIEIKPDYADAYFNRGTVQLELQRYEEAYDSCNKALELNPGHPYAISDRLLCQMYLGDWDNFDQRRKELIRLFEKGTACPAPFHMLAIPCSAEIQLQVAEKFTSIKYPQIKPPLWQEGHYHHQKIRIGYFSADFHRHATAYLMAELFERHDRARFEIHAFSFGPKTDDEMQQRLIKAFDHFHEVATLSDREIAALAHQHEIDIAVDLKGYTQDCRTGIFAYRPAPIQVNYLGYPGTMGSPYIDYIIADPAVIPLAHFAAYSEKVVHLPHSYQVNDSRREINPVIPGRAELELPENGFVFCCFNNNFKITPDIFDIWMRLLKKVEGSVLWLLEGNTAIVANLGKEAQRRDVDAGRIVFAPRTDLAKHLARHKQADLFLDTFYCNAHTTTSDSLWAGLPVLTCQGETFASRVASSLLQAANLPELVTTSHQDYENLALTLATHPDKLAMIREKLEANRLTCALFDTTLFTKHLEDAYSRMIERHHQNLPPEHLVVQ